MVIISVVYPKSNESRFDHDYYATKHMPLVWSRFGNMGLVSVNLMRGNSNLNGSQPTYELLGFLTFESEEKWTLAISTHGEEILADVLNFTDIPVVVQMNQPISA